MTPLPELVRLCAGPHFFTVDNYLGPHFFTVDNYVGPHFFTVDTSYTWKHFINQKFMFGSPLWFLML